MFHSWLKEILLSSGRGFNSVGNSNAFSQKEDLDFRVIKPFLKILSNMVLVYMDPEHYGFKETRGMFRSQGPMHLGLTEALTKGTLKMGFCPIQNKGTKSYTYPIHKGRMLLSQSLKTLMKGGVIPRLTRDPFDLLSGLPIKDKDRNTYRPLDGLPHNRIVRRDRGDFYQSIKGTILWEVNKLLNAVESHSKKRMKLSEFTLMTISLIALWLLRKVLLDELFLKCFQKDGDNGSVDLWIIFFTNISGSDSVEQCLNQPIDYQSRISYLKNQAKLHYDLAQRIPHFVGYAKPLIKLESISFFIRINYSHRYHVSFYKTKI